MAYYPELSPYRHGLAPTPWPADGPQLPGFHPFAWIHDLVGAPEPAFAVPELNVGWLDVDHRFPTGELSSRAVARLEETVAASLYHLTRGKHACPFCGLMGEDAVGSAEIRVPGTTAVFAAPNLVAHYVTVHRYLPPQPFVVALESHDGLEARPVPGTRRAVPADLLVPRMLDEGAIAARLAAQLSARRLNEQIVVSRLQLRAGLSVWATLRPQASVVERSILRRVSGEFLVDTEQVAYGVMTMLSACLESLKEEVFVGQVRRSK